jgi:hypothetical protein
MSNGNSGALLDQKLDSGALLQRVEVTARSETNDNYPARLKVTNMLSDQELSPGFIFHSDWIINGPHQCAATTSKDGKRVMYISWDEIK